MPICAWSMCGGSPPGAVGWTMPVLRRTRAIEEMMLRVGSHARNPHTSSRSKPL